MLRDSQLQAQILRDIAAGLEEGTAAPIEPEDFQLLLERYLGRHGARELREYHLSQVPR